MGQHILALIGEHEGPEESAYVQTHLTYSNYDVEECSDQNQDLQPRSMGV